LVGSVFGQENVGIGAVGAHAQGFPRKLDHPPVVLHVGCLGENCLGLRQGVLTGFTALSGLLFPCHRTFPPAVETCLILPGRPRGAFLIAGSERRACTLLARWWKMSES